MAIKTSDRGEKNPFIYDPQLYIATCLDCARQSDNGIPIRMPFSSTDTRNAWVGRHTEDTGHEDIRVLIVRTSDWRIKP